MTTPNPPVPAPKPFSHPFNPRTAAMLVAFAVLICITVLLADHFSTRDRHPASSLPATTLPATSEKGVLLI